MRHPEVLTRVKLKQDAERLFVANNLAVTLQESAGDFQGALLLLEEVLAVRRETLGNEHADTLDSITNLALHHTETGNYADALKLRFDREHHIHTSLRK
jgi:hypothetical protein